MERFRTDKPGISRESSAELVGPYVLLTEIGRGDLATVHLAKKHGALGFQRLYALKRLKPSLAGSLEHVELLLDEARLVSGIHHANIAGVLDVGTDAGSYVVMEYVEGESLDGLLVRAGAERNPRFVVPALVDALHGLHALHTSVDDLGGSCAIVHQAPRARHVLLGVDGTARLIDFSQVRGPNVRPSRCRSDRLKVAYMAPEMALHPDGVDVRADLFVVGVTLWESLTGERLFFGDNDDQTFQNMLHRRIPRPSEVGLGPPRCFDAICMRALERDRTKRYSSALEMARDLRDTALNEALYATSVELGQWVRMLAGKELRERRRLSGMETPSSGGISIETPAVGMDRSALSDGRSDASPGSGAGASDEPSTNGRIFAGSHPRVSLDEREENTATPAVGLRRSAPLPRTDADDDEPTAQRAALPETIRPAAESSGMTMPRAEDVARATTMPMIAQPAPAVAGPLEELRDAAVGPSQESLEDQDRTQPNVFVPARPGARRDAAVASPGAYSQVDARRGRSTTTEQPNAARAAGFDEVPTTQHAAGVVAQEGERVAKASERAAAPAEASEPASASERAAAPLRAKAVSSMQGRRSGAITEAPPIYVQRRDSSPTRMQMPEGPVGAPHRVFPSEDTNSAIRALEASPGDQSQPRLRAPGPRAGFADSLTPSSAAAYTAPPEPPEPMARSWVMWLASGVLAAIIFLALGVGIKQWIAGPQRPLPSTRHAAHAGAVDEWSQDEARGEPSERASEQASADAGVAGARQRTERPVAPRAAPAPRSTASGDVAPDFKRAAPAGQSPALQPAAPRPQPSRPRSIRRKAAGGLPDNPY